MTHTSGISSAHTLTQLRAPALALLSLSMLTTALSCTDRSPQSHRKPAPLAHSDIKSLRVGRDALATRKHSAKTVLESRGLTNFDSAPLQDENLDGLFREVNGQPQPNRQALDLRRANLRGAYVRNALLAKSDLRGADLSNAYLTNTDLSDATLVSAKLTKAHLNRAILSNAELRNASASGAFLKWTVLNGADLRYVNFSKCRFHAADLSHTRCNHADFSHSTMKGVNLSHADLTGANLQEADLSDSDLTNCVFEPIQLPQPNTLVRSKGLRHLQSHGDTTAMVELIDKLRKAGFTAAKRDVICSLERARTAQQPLPLAWARTILFDWTCEYGAAPFRPLVLILTNVALLSLVYFYSLFRKQQHIWIANEDPIQDGEIKSSQPLVNTIRTISPSTTDETRPYLSQSIRLFDCFLWGLYFSLVSGFRLGYRDVNISAWIGALQRTPFQLRAIGWVKTISGAQSLTSLYLFFLWIVTTFFEAPFGP